MSELLQRRAGVRTLARAAHGLMLLVLTLIIAAPAQADVTSAVLPDEALEALGEVTIHANGRPMPLDTYAELTLLQLSGRSSYEGQDALSWLFRVWMEPAEVFDDEVFLVNHPQVLYAAGFEEGGRGRYSFRELRGGFVQLGEAVTALEGKEESEFTAFEQDMVRVHRNLQHLSRLMTAFDFARPHEDFAVPPAAHSLIEVAGSPVRAGGSMEQLRIWSLALQWADRRQGSPLAVIPHYGPEGETWLPPDVAAVDTSLPPAYLAEAQLLAEAFFAHRADDDGALVAALTDFNQSVRARSATAGQPLRVGLEVLYNRVNPFAWATAAYALGLALLSALLFTRRRWPEGGALAALCVGGLVHAGGLVARIIMTQRPPVTSLYSSFIFVGWVLAALGLLIAVTRNRRLGLLLGLVSAFALTYLSSGIAAERDTLGVLQAVLNTNFWLSTHVVVITLGYAGCIAAGVIGHVYLVQRIVRPYDERRLRSTYGLLYGVLVVGLILSFVGTMLGGIWADQSWGRFWGWDPKENGALLIVLWCAILLHAKAARIIGQEGMAIGSVVGVLVVMFSWLGVNMMGVGLHSYGFTSGVGGAFVLIFGTELLFIAATFTILRLRNDSTPLGLTECRVKDVIRETSDSVSLQLQPPRGRTVTYEPGMYASLFVRVDGITYRRPYSFSSAPREDGSVTLTAKRVAGGVVSHYLLDRVRIGERVQLGPPTGNFAYEGSEPGTPVFVAGGSGIAPCMSILEALLADDSEASAVLIYGNHAEEDIIFRERIDEMAAAHPNLAVHYYLQEPPAGWSGGVGRISVEAIRAAAPGNGALFLLSGPEGMVAELARELRERGVSAERIREERFAAAAQHVFGRNGAVHAARFAESEAVVSVKPGQSLLEAGLKHGLNLDYSCAAGRCGDCRCKVAEGSLVMDEPNCLTPEERQEGFVLSCVAYPTSDVSVELQ